MTHRKSEALVIPRDKFKEKILERIEKGKELLAYNVTGVPELEQNQSDYKIWDGYNLEYLKNSFNIEGNQYRASYKDCTDWVGGGPMALGHYTNKQILENLKKRFKLKIENLQMLAEKTDLLKIDMSKLAGSSSSTTEKKASTEEKDMKKVFIVHGHNNELKQEVARTLEKLKLEPIILHEQANEGQTVIEKFEKHADVNFAIVLLTKDDLGKVKSAEELTPRARQNVILELGYFIGKLGRKHVVPLYENGVELPSDLNGVVYVAADAGGNWKFTLVRELKAVNYDVDANDIV